MTSLRALFLIQWLRLFMVPALLQLFFCSFSTYFEEFSDEYLGPVYLDEVARSGSPHLLRKRDQIKMRDYVDRRITPPKRVTSPTLGIPPPCKQALNSFLTSNSPTPNHSLLIYLYFLK